MTWSRTFWFAAVLTSLLTLAVGLSLPRGAGPVELGRAEARTIELAGAGTLTASATVERVGWSALEIPSAWPSWNALRTPGAVLARVNIEVVNTSEEMLWRWFQISDAGNPGGPWESSVVFTSTPPGRSSVGSTVLLVPDGAHEIELRIRHSNDRHGTAAARSEYTIVLEIEDLP